jgi:hypothetical protein
MPSVMTAGTPSARAPAGTVLLLPTSAPAPTRAASPTTARCNTIDPEPTSARCSTRQPSRWALWPMVTSSPIQVGDQGIVCTMVPSWTEVRAPTTIGPLSPRSTAVGHTELCSPIVTSPITTASG